jgi:hypothetical protein
VKHSPVFVLKAFDTDRAKARLAYVAACKVAASFVERDWRVIDAVARRLLEVGYLRGDQVAQLIESVPQEEEQ